MAVKRDDILKALEDLVQVEDVLAVMVAKQGLEGIIPAHNKIQNVDLWRLIRDTTDTLFVLIDRFYDYGLSRLHFELGEYTVIIAPISRTFSILVVIPSIANLGLLDIAIENVKQKIEELGGKDG